MLAKSRWSHLLASALALTVASSSFADDVFVKEGVIVKPLPKWKQRRLEKKLLKRPGNEVVIEGAPTVVTSPEVVTGTRARRAFRPLFGDRFGRRNETIVSSPSTVITSPSTIVSSPSTVVSNSRSVIAPGDPLVVPGSVEVSPTPRVVRPPVVSTPRGQTVPVDPLDEPELEMERPASARILPAPVEEVPVPVVSSPRKPISNPSPTSIPMPSTTPAPVVPTPSTLPPVDPGPPSTSPPPATEPVGEPILELPVAPKPA